MSVNYLNLSPHDPLIARDGRPFGLNQGQRMRGLPWLLPSVVAGSLRTALVKAKQGMDFDDATIKDLLTLEVGGVFPVLLDDKNAPTELFLPAPSDAVAQPTKDGKGIETLHRVAPQPLEHGGCDFPDDLALQPVMLPKDPEDFKPADLPAWWPLSKYEEWLTTQDMKKSGDWLRDGFLGAAKQELRDHVCLDADRGAAEEGKIFASAGLNVGHLPRFGMKEHGRKLSFAERFAPIALAARVTIPKDGTFGHVQQLDQWHPLGGERRLVHWHHSGVASLWKCPETVEKALAKATNIRMVLATPAIFSKGWRPGWLDDQLEGTPPGANVKLKLVGVSNHRWKAVSGWSLAPPRGPKAIRRMVPAGSVYFFKVVEGDPAPLVDRWLQSVSDGNYPGWNGEQNQHDGFGLAVWGTW